MSDKNKIMNGEDSDQLTADDLLNNILSLSEDDLDDFPSCEEYVYAYECARKLLGDEEMTEEEKEALREFVDKNGPSFLLTAPEDLYPELQDEEDDEEDDDNEPTNEQILEELKDVDPFEEVSGHKHYIKQIKKLCAMLSLRFDEDDPYDKEDLVSAYKITQGENPGINIDKHFCKPLELACISVLIATQDHRKVVDMLNTFVAQSSDEGEQETASWIKAQILFIEKDYTEAIPCFEALRESGSSMARVHAAECVIAMKNELGKMLTPRDIATVCNPQDLHLQIKTWPLLRSSVYDEPDGELTKIYRAASADDDDKMIQMAFMYQHELGRLYVHKINNSMKVLKRPVFRMNKKLSDWAKEFISRNNLVKQKR